MNTKTTFSFAVILLIIAALFSTGCPQLMGGGPDPTPTPTATATAEANNTATPTPTFTATSTPTVTPTPTPIGVTGTWLAQGYVIGGGNTTRPFTLKLILVQDANSTVKIKDGYPYYMVDTNGSRIGNALDLNVTLAMQNGNSTYTYDGNITSETFIFGNIVEANNTANDVGDFNMTKLSGNSTVITTTLPVASITTDGALTDWSNVSTINVDTTNDKDFNNTQPNGSDITSLKVATDSGKTKLNMLLTLDEDVNQSITYEFFIFNYNTTTYSNGTKNKLTINYNTGNSTWNKELEGGSNNVAGITVTSANRCIEAEVLVSDLRARGFDENKTFKVLATTKDTNSSANNDNPDYDTTLVVGNLLKF